MADDPLAESLRPFEGDRYAYYGITGNSMALNRFREEVRRVWYKWLVRRKRATAARGVGSPGSKSATASRSWQPSTPCVECEAKESPEEPDAGVLHVWICGSPG